MTEQDADPQTNHWHLDKRVPVALIVALMLQFSASIYWIARLESRTMNNETRIATLESRVDPLRLIMERIDQRLIGIEQALRDDRSERQGPL